VEKRTEHALVILGRVTCQRVQAIYRSDTNERCKNQGGTGKHSISRTKWECLQTTKASVTIMYTTFSRCFGLAEVFIERDGPVEAWAIDRTEDGLSIWAGRIHVNASFTRKNRKTLLAVALGLAIYGAFVATGRNIGDNPLEVAGWAVLARKYTA
jgi:hypothetical protein